MTEPNAEDQKLVVLARGALSRSAGTEGAAVRDLDGRTYAAGQVSLPSLSLTALQAAVAAAVSSGAEGFEAAVIVGGAANDPGVHAVRDLTGSAVVSIAATDGSLIEVPRG